MLMDFSDFREKFPGKPQKANAFCAGKPGERSFFFKPASDLAQYVHSCGRAGRTCFNGRSGEIFSHEKDRSDH
ncbi:hypothetical protein D3C73_1483090 [compost metagenome]